MHTNYSEVCLSFTYVLILIEEQSAKDPSAEETDETIIFDQEKHLVKFNSLQAHALTDIFKKAKTKCNNSIFNFGFYMKESLRNFKLVNLFVTARKGHLPLPGLDGNMSL